MIEPLKNNLKEWDQFWFQKRSPNQVGWVRACAGLIAFIQFVEYMISANEWFGAEGWFDPEAGRFFIGDGVQGTGSQYRWTVLYFAPDSGFVVSLIGLIASGLMVIGVGSRITPLIAAISLAQFHHRAPFLVSIHEPLLYALLTYLVIDPGRTNWGVRPALATGVERISVNIAIQLMRCHLWLWIAFGLAAMLSNGAWWNGEAIWSLMRSGSGWLQFGEPWQFLGQWLTHLVLAVQFGVLIAMIHPSLRWLGKYFFYAYIVCVLLLLGNVLYAAVLFAAGLAVWPIGGSMLLPERAGRYADSVTS